MVGLDVLSALLNLLFIEAILFKHPHQGGASVQEKLYGDFLVSHQQGDVEVVGLSLLARVTLHLQSPFTRVEEIHLQELGMAYLNQKGSQYN